MEEFQEALELKIPLTLSVFQLCYHRNSYCINFPIMEKFDGYEEFSPKDNVSPFCTFKLVRGIGLPCF